VVDTNDQCVGLGKFAVRRGGFGMLHTGARCETIVLFLVLAVSFHLFCVEGDTIKHHTRWGTTQKITRNI
jgi:hypothetical protein